MKASILKHARTTSTIIIVLLFSISLWQLAAAGWIQGKAIIAQQLLNSSWEKTLLKPERHTSGNRHTSDLTNTTHKPWPWADTWPVAKLIVPQHDIEQIVLAGDSGSSLAFGPGHSLASAMPNTLGTAVISAHRDTHFRFLKELTIDETIFIQTPDKTTAYQVSDIKIVDSKHYMLDFASDRKTLVLVSCYPFNALSSGGTLRYLVYAVSTT